MQNILRFFCVSFALFFFGSLSAADYQEANNFSRSDFFNEFNEPIVPQGIPSWFKFANFLNKNALYNKIHHVFKNEKTVDSKAIYDISYMVACDAIKTCYLKPTAQTITLLGIDFAYLLANGFIPSIVTNHETGPHLDGALHGSFDTVWEGLNLVVLYNIWSKTTPEAWHH